MRKSIISVVVLSAISATAAHAATGLLTQDPNAPASNYDVIQDKAYQAAANLANSALTQNQQIVAQVNTVTAGVGTNALAIGKTNASVGTANQNIQQNTQGIAANAQAIGKTNAALGQTNQTVQQNWNQQNQNNQVLAQQINKNAAQINGLTQQTGNFVTKPDFTTDQARQDKALTDATTKQTAVDKAQDAKINGVNNKNKTQDGLITGLRTDVDANKAGVAANTAAIATKVSDADFKADQARQDGLIAKKADQTGLDTANKKIADNAAEIAASKTNISKVNDGLTQEIADRKAGDAKLQTSVDTNSKLITTKADTSQVNALAVSTGAMDQKLQSDINANKAAITTKVSQADYDKGQAAQDKRITENFNDNLTQEGDIHKLKIDNIQRDKRIDAVDQSVKTEASTRAAADVKLTADIAANKTAIATKADAAALTKEQQNRLAADQQLATRINGKVDTATYTAGQAAQDKSLNDETTARTAADKQHTADISANKATIAGKVGQADVDKTVKVETDRATTAENKLSDRVTTTENTQKLITANIKHIGDVNTKQTSDIAANKTGISTLAGEVAQKVSVKDFKADQKRQDTALATETTRAKGVESTLTTKVATNSGLIGANTASINGTKVEVAKVKTDVAKKVDKTTYDAGQKAQDAAIAKKVDQTTYDAGQASQDSLIAQNTSAINSINTSGKQAGVVAQRNSKRLDQHDQRISKNESDIKDLRKSVKAVGAGSVASANLHYNRNENGYAVAVGEYDGATAIAGGLQFNTSTNTAITVQASYDGEAAGASVGFHGSW